LFIELIGVGVLLWSIIRALISLFCHKKKMRLELAEGIALALEFKMGGELLRTVIVRDWTELLILGAVIALRAALTFLIQWEIRLEKKNVFTYEEEKQDEEKEDFCNHVNHE
jgi:uncharacterized membrane protein